MKKSKFVDDVWRSCSDVLIIWLANESLFFARDRKKRYHDRALQNAEVTTTVMAIAIA